jgi:hypothetical protein
VSRVYRAPSAISPLSPPLADTIFHEGLSAIATL